MRSTETAAGGTPLVTDGRRGTEALGREARRLYRHLKARHVDGHGLADRCVHLDALEAAGTVEDAERALTALLERDLAVTDGEVAMWRPGLSDGAEATLARVRAGEPVDRDDPAAACLREMGLIEWSDGGHRLRW